MGQSSEQLRKDVNAGIKFTRLLAQVFPDTISPELLAALDAAVEHPHLLDLLIKQMNQVKV